MKKALILLVVLGLSFFCIQPVIFAQTAGKATQGETIIDVNNKVCPVMGNPASADHTAVYKGKRYNFCCSGCVNAFKKDPEKYVAKLGQTEKKGS